MMGPDAEAYVRRSCGEGDVFAAFLCVSSFVYPTCSEPVRSMRSPLLGMFVSLRGIKEFFSPFFLLTSLPLRDVHIHEKAATIIRLFSSSLYFFFPSFLLLPLLPNPRELIGQMLIVAV